jgi:hypothetical protein
MAVLWPKDPPPGGHIKLKPTLAAGRGEGAALAAAGRLAIHSDVITGAGVRSVGGGTTDEAVGSLCAGVSGRQMTRRCVVPRRQRSLGASGAASPSGSSRRACRSRGRGKTMNDGGVREPPFDHLKKPRGEQCWLDDDTSYA